MKLFDKNGYPLILLTALLGDVYCGEAYSTVLSKTYSKVAEMSDQQNCLVFDVEVFNGGPGEITQVAKNKVANFCKVSEARISFPCITQALTLELYVSIDLASKPSVLYKRSLRSNSSSL